MAGKIPSTQFDDLKLEITAYFNENHNLLRLAVPESEQQKEIDLLKETLMSNDRFFFVIDLLNFEMMHPFGIQKWLGYSEREFTLKQYWDKVVHPSRKQTLLLIVRQMYEVLCRGTYPLQFMVQRFSTLVPLRHYQGHYILTKKTASVFQYDINNRLIAYLDEFTIVSHDYNGEPLNPVMYNSHGEREVIKEKEIMAKAMERFLSMKIFTSGELQSIRLLAYNPKLTQSSIARHLGLSVYTIDTYYKRFLTKARSFYGVPFASVLDAALHLKREGLL